MYSVIAQLYLGEDVLKELYCTCQVQYYKGTRTKRDLEVSHFPPGSLVVGARFPSSSVYNLHHCLQSQGGSMLRTPLREEFVQRL